MYKCYEKFIFVLFISFLKKSSLNELTIFYVFSMLESEFIKDTGVSINKMIEHSSKIPTPVHQTTINTQNSRTIKEPKISYLPVKKDRTLTPAYLNQQRYDSNEHVVARTTNNIKRNVNSRGKRLSVPVMSGVSVDLTKDANGNLVKFAAKRPQSCCVDSDSIVLTTNKNEKSLSDESLDKNSRNKPLSRLPIRYLEKHVCLFIINIICLMLLINPFIIYRKSQGK